MSDAIAPKSSQSLTFNGDRIKRIRIALGETQEIFAVRIGKTANMVSRWEHDENVPTAASTINALLRAEIVAGLA